jgi:hypothetical protein
MARNLFLFVLVGLFVASPASAQKRRAMRHDAHRMPVRAERRFGQEAATSPIRAMLQKRVDSVEWDEAPFSDVIDWLRAQGTEFGTVNIVPRWKALDIESIDRDSVITLEMRNTTVKDVLDEVLDQLSDIDPLTYLGDGNKLKISTKSDFDKVLYTRVYDIQDIHFELRDFSGSPQINLNQQQQQGGGGGQGGQTRVESIFGNSGGGGGNNDNEDEDDDDDERNDEITDWIRATVEPDSWDENGGLGTVEVFNRQLIVRNTLTVHEILGGPFNFNE